MQDTQLQLKIYHWAEMALCAVLEFEAIPEGFDFVTTSEGLTCGYVVGCKVLARGWDTETEEELTYTYDTLRFDINTKVKDIFTHIQQSVECANIALVKHESLTPFSYRGGGS